MPELYPGQAQVIADKLAQGEALLAANQDRLEAETDPLKRAALRDLIAGQSGTVGAYRRALQKAESDTDTTRADTYKIRFSAAERFNLENKAARAGQTLAQYIRACCGLS